MPRARAFGTAISAEQNGDAVPICRGGNAYFVGCADAASSVDQRSASNGTISADKDIFAT